MLTRVWPSGSFSTLMVRAAFGLASSGQCGVIYFHHLQVVVVIAFRFHLRCPIFSCNVVSVLFTCASLTHLEST